MCKHAAGLTQILPRKMKNAIKNIKELNEKNAKCFYLQEDFLKENILIQIRMVLDRRNLKHNMEEGDYTFSS